MKLQNHAECRALRGLLQESVHSGIDATRFKASRTGAVLWSAAVSRLDRVILLRKGRVRIVGTGRRGEEIVLGEVLPGEFFGELCLCSHANEPRPDVRAIACCPAETVTVSYRAFRTLLTREPDALSATLAVMCRRLSHAEQRLQILSEADSRERLRLLLLYVAATRRPDRTDDRASVAVTITHAELAGMASLSRPHLSGLMTEFRRAGKVSYRRGSALTIHAQLLAEEF